LFIELRLTEVLEGEMAIRQGAGVPPTAMRLRALMDVLGYRGHGAQTRFAAQCDFRDAALSQFLRNRALTWAAVSAIHRRFPRVSVAFLLQGLLGHPLDPDIEARLLQWEREPQMEVFTRPRL
jgi:hypothetical protein